MPAMLDFEAVLRHFWPRALEAIHSWGEDTNDEKGFMAIGNEYLSTRREDLHAWLQSYSVFQGLTGAQRDQITGAVLSWADVNKSGRDLTRPEALVEAHKEIEGVCQACVSRDFTSLASKALWLCYPKDVPLYDSYAKNALHIISKLEDGITSMPQNSPPYEQFVHVWKQLYQRYKAVIDALEIGSYPYRVRVFDVVLWLIGQPSYRTD